MAEATLCAVEGCSKEVHGRGWCIQHYSAWRRNGDPISRRRLPKGRMLAWLMEQLSVTHNQCIVWPFSVSENGYGVLKFHGTIMGPHRAMCIVAHGVPDSAGSDAAHSCGNRLCVNPQHIRWATRSENHLDKLEHGTDNRGVKNPKAKLTEEDVRNIRAQLGYVSQRSLARMFGIDQSTVSDIKTRRKWGWLP